MTPPSLRTRTAYGQEVDILNCAPVVQKPSAQRTQSSSPTLEARMKDLLFTPSLTNTIDEESRRRFGSTEGGGWERPMADSRYSSASSSPENGFSSVELNTPMSSISSTRSSSFSKFPAEHYQPSDNVPRLAHVAPSAPVDRRIFQAKRTQSLPIVPRKRSPTSDYPEVHGQSSVYRHHSQTAVFHPTPEFRSASFTTKEPLPSIDNLFQIAGASQPIQRSPTSIRPPPTDFLQRRSSGVDPLDMDNASPFVPSTRKSDLVIMPIKEERPHPMVIFTDADASESDSMSRSPSPAKRRRSQQDLTASTTDAAAAGPAGQSRPVNKRKFPCQICGKLFTTSGHLSRHGRTHTGEKRYECPHESCDARFSRQDNCMQHFRTHSNSDSRRKKRRPATSTTVSPPSCGASAENFQPTAAPNGSLNGPDLLAALANAAAMADRGALPA